MKLYEYTIKRQNTSYIGAVLVKNDETVCFDRVFSTNREKYPYLSAIEMAVSYVHNQEPNLKEDLILYGEHLGVNDPLTSMYVEKVLPYQKVVPNTAELTEKDESFLALAKKRVEATVSPIDMRAMTQNIWYD